MIAKRIDMRDASKSRATRLAKYVTDELERAGRVADVFTANCISDDFLLAAKEIEICQAKNTRAKDDKTYHLLLSFADGERPDKEQIRAMSDAAAKALGYGEHQRIAVVHDDTDNLHIHLIINKIHPERHTIHTPRKDFKILAELCARLERDNSLQQTNHAPEKSIPETKAMDMEAHSGMESFLSYAKAKAAPLLSTSPSWHALHAALADVGMSLRLRGNGLILSDQTGTIAVKASAVARAFSKGKLEKRFGNFVPHEFFRPMNNDDSPPTEKPSTAYYKKPSFDSENLYQQYQVAQQALRQERKTRLDALWTEQKQIIQRIAATARLDLPKAASYHLKRTLRLKARTAANAAITEVRRSMAMKREEVKTQYKSLGYVEWLKREAESGNIDAIYALRKRGAVAPALINITARDLHNAKLIAAKIAHVTGRGTLFYRVGHDVFRDNGTSVSIMREVSDDGIIAALRIAMIKFPDQPLVVNGADQFKARCVDAAARHNMPLKFLDRDMEEKRLTSLRVNPETALSIPNVKDNENDKGMNTPKTRQQMTR